MSPRDARLFVAFVSLLSASALAQPTPDVDLERFHFNPGGEGSVTFQTGELMQAGQFRGSTALHYQSGMRVLQSEGGLRSGRIEHRGVMHFAVAYAARDWFQISAQVPAIGYQRADDLSGRAVPISNPTGLGTPWLAMRFGLLREEDEGGDPVSLALEIAGGLPLGTTSFSGSNQPQALPRLSIGGQLGTVRLGGELGTLLRWRKDLAPGTTGNLVHNELLGGAVMGIGDSSGVRGELGVRASYALANQTVSTEILGGVRYAVDPGMELFLLAGPGFGRAPGTPFFRILVGGALGSMPRAIKARSDDDEELGPRLKAACLFGAPHHPADCPDLDADGDGIKNRVDACPTQKEDIDQFEDQDGCVDADNDKDGLQDAQDRCPGVPGTQGSQGCPVQDGDKDGVVDGQDKCPSEAGPPEQGGCPIKDGDKDGVADDKDKCPSEPGKPEYDGCASKDTDGDGVTDAQDNCINEKGTQDNKGCPARQRQLVTITREKLVINDRVYFAPSKARLLPASSRMLNQIAKILREHPEIPKVTIEGHTDSLGHPEANRTLSQARAEAVKTYLVQQGVDPSKVATVGMGADKPLEDNATPEGRAANRRVEFNITQAQGVEENAPAPAQEPASP